MIISASRRTDIPAFYSQWFFKRLEEGFAMARNPMNRRQVSKVLLTPEVVDCIVLWTKNPAPMLDQLYRLEKYPYYVQFTLNSYGREVEPGIPGRETSLQSFCKLSGLIGADRVVWRYDPIFLNEQYTPDFHEKAFCETASRLEGKTGRCVISFLDDYAKVRKRMAPLQAHREDGEIMEELAGRLAVIAHGHGMEVYTCAENMELERFGIRHGACIDGKLIEKLTGKAMDFAEGRNQRAMCCCAASVDVGAYDTCAGGCLYCYACRGGLLSAECRSVCDPASPILCGSLTENDKVTVREVKTHKKSKGS